MRTKITSNQAKENAVINSLSDWPELPWTEWQETASTLNLWFQVVGKIRLALATPLNHWWHVAFYITCRGLTTSPMPYGNRMLQIDFDFIHHQVIFQTSDGFQETLALRPMSVSDFYDKVMDKMMVLGMPIKIYTLPTEIPGAVPFEQDQQHSAYDSSYATRFWRILLQTERVATAFQSRYVGKVSPVHFFWGGFDLAVTRFSGRLAPKHDNVPGIPDAVVQSAYSHEVSSFGFWPGGSSLPEPVFYSYAYPAPPGFAKASVQPNEAYFFEPLGEFVLPYEAVRAATDPEQALWAFMQSTYEAAADLGQWNRAELELVSL